MRGSSSEPPPPGRIGETLGLQPQGCSGRGRLGGLFRPAERAPSTGMSATGMVREDHEGLEKAGKPGGCRLRMAEADPVDAVFGWRKPTRWMPSSDGGDRPGGCRLRMAETDPVDAVFGWRRPTRWMPSSDGGSRPRWMPSSDGGSQEAEPFGSPPNGPSTGRENVSRRSSRVRPRAARCESPERVAAKAEAPSGSFASPGAIRRRMIGSQGRHGV